MMITTDRRNRRISRRRSSSIRKASAACIHVDALEPRRLLAAGDLIRLLETGADETRDAVNDVVVDAEGFTYITGAYQRTVDFDPSPSRRTTLTSVSDELDAFVAKYDPAGRLVWARSFGGRKTDVGRFLSVGPDGSVYVAGRFDGVATFATRGMSVTLESSGDEDVFVLKLAANGRLRWVGQVGGGRADDVTALATDPAGDVYLAGTFRLKADLDPGPGVHEVVTRGVDDSFVARISGRTGSLFWATAFGELNTSEDVRGLAVSGDGRLYIAGSYLRKIDFARRQAGFELDSDDRDGYLARLRAATGRFDWVRRVAGGEDEQRVTDLALAPDGDVVLIGDFSDPAVLSDGLAANARSLSFNVLGERDGFIARYTRHGSLLWANRVGGSRATVEPLAVAVGPDDRVYVTGTIFTEDDDRPVDFDPGAGVANLFVDKDGSARPMHDQLEATDAFVLRLTSGGSFSFVRQIAGEESSVRGKTIAAGAGRVFVGGDFLEETDFDPGPGTVIRSTEEDDDSESDLFLLTLEA